MKKKSLLLTAVATLGLTASTMAQNVPSYVPTNGLVGWWPFNGNANDESGFANNGLVDGATLTNDRFDDLNKAYNFDGINDHITIAPSSNNDVFNSNQMTFSIWAKLENNQDFQQLVWMNNKGILKTNSNEIRVYDGNSFYIAVNDNSLNFGQWFHIVATYNNDTIGVFVNGVLLYQGLTWGNATINYTNDAILLGYLQGQIYRTKGILDDFSLYNRALTQDEVTSLYNAISCTNNTAITPTINSLTTGSTATFNATTSDLNPSYVWQSNFGQGFQSLNNFGNYSGANTATLNIANVQLPNHTQPIRVISTSGNCIDTSNVAVINILDTCITNVTVYDTLFTTVTDTLVINAQITGINPPNNLNTLKVFPNPASTHITIDYGNFNAMSGYTLTIVNSIGQTVFTTPINQQTSYIDLSTWTGSGIYFVQLIDPQNNTIENRKIVIQ